MLPEQANALFPETLRVNTSRVIAIFCSEKVVSNVFWGFLPDPELQTPDGRRITSEEASKMLVLWENTTIGALFLLAIAEETDENLFHWKKQILTHMPVPDFEILSQSQVHQICELFDKFAYVEWFNPIHEQIKGREKFDLDESYLKIIFGGDEHVHEEISRELEKIYHLSTNLLHFSKN